MSDPKFTFFFDGLNDEFLVKFDAAGLHDKQVSAEVAQVVLLSQISTHLRAISHVLYEKAEDDIPGALQKIADELSNIG